jgi:hypothetical protein
MELFLIRLVPSKSDRRLPSGISSRLRLVKRLEGKENMNCCFDQKVCFLRIEYVETLARIS